MAKKKVVNFIKLQIPAGAANPAPPVGPALGAAQVNIMQFCQAFNAATQDKAGDIIPVEISVYEDRSFDFVCKTPPAAQLIKKELGLKSGSGGSSPRSPRSRCRTSTPTTSRPPRRSSPAPPAPWVSPSPSNSSHCRGGWSPSVFDVGGRQAR